MAKTIRMFFTRSLWWASTFNDSEHYSNLQRNNQSGSTIVGYSNYPRKKHKGHIRRAFYIILPSILHVACHGDLRIRCSIEKKDIDVYGGGVKYKLEDIQCSNSGSRTIRLEISNSPINLKQTAHLPTEIAPCYFT